MESTHGPADGQGATGQGVTGQGASGQGVTGQGVTGQGVTGVGASGQAGRPVLRWRSEFPILGHTTYMISHSLGAMPERTRGRMLEYADTWATRGIRAW